jgi:hypothetical protein
MRGGAKGSFSTGPLAPGPLDEFISSPAYFLQDRIELALLQLTRLTQLGPRARCTSRGTKFSTRVLAKFSSLQIELLLWY